MSGIKSWMKSVFTPCMNRELKFHLKYAIIFAIEFILKSVTKFRLR
jgi:hypothetical protein